MILERNILCYGLKKCKRLWVKCKSYKIYKVFKGKNNTSPKYQLQNAIIALEEAKYKVRNYKIFVSQGLKL